MNKHASAMGKLSRKNRTPEQLTEHSRRMIAARETKRNGDKQSTVFLNQLFNKMPMNWTKNFKTKEEALVAILDGLVNNSATAGLDGNLYIQFGGKIIPIKPKPKTRKEEI